MSNWEQPALGAGRESIVWPCSWRFILAASLLTPSYAVAADKTWTGASSSNWSTTGNWTGGVPAATDNALLNTITPNPAAIGAGVTASAAQVRLGTASGGKASITISGGKLTDSQGLIGQAAGSTGSVTVTGAGSTWTNATALTIGVAGTGSLNVLSGATVSGGTTVLGASINSNGKGLISGTNSTLYSKGGLTVGSGGTGALTVDNGGRVLLRDAAGNSDVLTGNIIIGTAGTGSLTISSGGVVSSANAYINGSGIATSSAIVTGVGSSWNAGNDQFIGNGAKGSLQILAGGAVSAGSVEIGHNLGSAGMARVSGAGSIWTATRFIFVGRNIDPNRPGTARGTLTIDDGGYVSTNEGSIGNGAADIGAVTVTGTGSTWKSTGNLIIGLYGTGSFALSNGAFADTADTFVGLNTAAKGTFSIDGGSHFKGSGEFAAGQNEGTTGAVTVAGQETWLESTKGQYIGRAGTGSLQILSGARASGLAGWVGRRQTGQGTVLVSGPESQWAITDTLTIGSAGAGEVTLSDLGKISAASIRIADQEGSTGTLNIGAAAGAAATQAGILNTGSISFGSGNGTLVLNHTDSAYQLSAVMSGAGNVRAEHGTTLLTSDSSGFLGNTAILSGATLQVGDGASRGVFGGSVANNGDLVFDRADDSGLAGTVSGAGRLTKAGAGTLTLSGNSSAFSGASTLATGGLALTGKLGGTLTARAGTVLSGTGSIGGIAAQEGSTISPGQASGNDVAALTVAGTYRQLPGSTYQAGLVPQGLLSDLIAVGGAATLDTGAVLNVRRLSSGAYGLNDVYTVLTAAGGVSGTYLLTGDTAVSEFYGLRAVYESNAVLLKVMQIRDFADVALTPNQIATAGGLSSLPSGNQLRDAIGLLGSGEEARRALDLLSGEIHASTAGAILQDSRFIRDAVLGRLRCTANDPARSEGSDCVDRAVWIEGYGASGDIDGNGNAAAMESNIEGFTIGADLALPGNSRLGVFGARGMSDVTVADRRSSASVESYDLGAYGGVDWNNFTLGLGGAYGWNNVTTSRQVGFPGFADTLEADYQSRMAQLFGEVGYTITAGPAGFEPFARLAYASLQTESFSETGGAAALFSRDQNNSVTLSTIGLRASAKTHLFDYEVTAKAMGGWQHGWGDLTPGMDFSFAGGSNFGITGAPAAEDAALVEAGLTAAAAGAGEFGLWYTGQFSADTKAQGLRASLAFRF